MKRGLVILLLVLSCAGIRAQDIHFSQVDADPLLLNPAYAGFFDGTGRFGMIYRNQWFTVSQPYQTLGVTGEMALWRDGNTGNGLSLGLSVFRDQAGSLNYGTTSGHISASYFFTLNRYHNNYLALGFDGGWAQMGFDPSLAEMENPSEIIDNYQISYPLVGVGMAWYWQPLNSLSTRLGVSVRNLNKPNISFSELDNTYLWPRFSLFARAEWRKWQMVSLMPMLMMQHQGQHNELVYGLDLKWYIDEGSRHESSLRSGLAMRHTDALIANMILEYDAFIFTFCYDANISQLSAASHGIGALEVGLVYRLAKTKKKTKAIKCPIY